MAPTQESQQSPVVSIPARRAYAIARSCPVWRVPRSIVYRLRRAAAVASAPRRRPGPQGLMPDAALVGAIRQVLADSPYGPRATARPGRGCVMRACAPPRSGCAALVGTSVDWTDVRSSSLRKHALSAASRVGRPRGPRAHDGTIIPERVDAMGDEPSSAIGPGTMANDMTATFTLEHGQVAVFVTVDHRSAECTGIHAALRATHHEALEPIREGVLERFGALAEGAAQGLLVRHDHGSQPMSHDVQREVARASGPCPRPPSSAPPRATAEARALHPDPQGEPRIKRGAGSAPGQNLPHRRGG